MRAGAHRSRPRGDVRVTPDDIRRIAARHSGLRQDGFPELQYLAPTTEKKEEQSDEAAD